MKPTTRFLELELLCRERARVVEQETNYWLAEADEWARFRRLYDRTNDDQGGPIFDNKNHRK